MIGIDLQEVARVRFPEKLLQKIALPSEIDYIHKFSTDFKMRVASLWAVKEAVFKALDIKQGEIFFKDIELCHKDSGAPYVKLHGKAKELFDGQIEISLSHQKSVVGAVAVAIKPKMTKE